MKSAAGWLFLRSLLATSRSMVGFVLALALFVPGIALAQSGAIDFDHVTTGFPLTGAHQDVRCETCHIKGIFKGTPRECGDCHVQNNPRSALAMSINHLRSTQTCDTCHSTMTFGGARFEHSMVLAESCASCHNGTNAMGKSPTHIVTSAPCSDCHKTDSFFTAIAIPSNHIPIPTGYTCERCHINLRGGSFATTQGIQNTPAAARARPAAVLGGAFAGGMMDHSGITGDCAQCHAPSVASTFYGVMIQSSLTSPPHVPAADNCETCHTPPTVPIPATGAAGMVGQTFAGARMSHTGITSNCAVCHGPSVVSGTFIGVTPMTNAALAPPHVPSSNTCEACHSNAIPTQPIPATGAASIGATTFANGQMSHAGITSGCDTCHGPSITGGSFFGITHIVVMPPTSPMGPNSHIPVGTTCESCHLASTPAGLVSANATATIPGTAFATPAPSTAQIHAGVTSGCNGCHEAGNSWLGLVNAYPIVPAAKTGGAAQQYTGFHTRPVTAASPSSVADAAHPNTGDCSQCHSSTDFFTGQDKPANHIPVAASSQCSDCHTSSDFAVMPSLANIHANAPSMSGNCAECHGSAAASFAIPGANFTVTGMPGNHIPTSAPCESCHVGPGSSMASLPVPNGASFSGSKMSHSGITNNCKDCHVPFGTSASFAGIASIVGMPATSPMGATSHIPSSTTCESCHMGSVPSGLIPANATKTAPGTDFATPAPTTAQIHSGVTSGCSSCHESSYVWMGVSAYPIAPTTVTGGATQQYTGFHTRPRAAAGTYNVADAPHPSTGDCSQCHSGTNFFSGQDKPANHIPFAATAQCSDCHTNGNDFAAMPTLTNIHANAPSMSGNCAQCHGSAAASFKLDNFTMVGMPTDHLPTSAPCESCHVGAGSSMAAVPVVDGAKFSGSKMSHVGITSNCKDCHVPAGSSASFAGITSVVGMPPTSPVGSSSHIPSSTTCESCHLGTAPAGLIPANATKTAPGTLFATPAPTTAQIHSGVTSGCSSCHESSYVWMGVSAYPIAPSVLTADAQYTGFHTRPRTAAGTYNVADAAHPSTGDCSQCHSSTNFFSGQDKPANHIPYAATAQCSSCHTSGNDYAAMPTLAHIHANAPSISTNCAQCHGNAAASFAIPEANFAIVGLPSDHIPTSASCEACHVGTGSSVPTTPVPDGSKFSGSRMSHAGITNNCVQCHVTFGSAANFKGITGIVGMPATAPVGANSHIPSSTTCESCHLGSLANVPGLVPANVAKTAPGTLFATPAPSTAQIHSGVISGCSSCHEANSVWMGVSAYPIAPAALSNVADQQYTGFQTRPRMAAGTFNVADPAHPSTGDCAQCHSSTNFFTGQDKPANHIPYAATAQCNSCHTSTDYATIPTLSNIHANAPSTSTNCAQCHGAAAASFAIPAANFSIVGLPNNHVPTSAACEACHVGTGSSIAVTPVVNGAKFSGSKMSHTGITNNCRDCHVPAGSSATFAGITNIVGMPPTSPVGSTSHIPSSTSCESCHLASTPAGLVPANATVTAPGTAFATPAPTTVQIHAGVTSGCSSCHESSYQWMGVSAYPIAPTVLTADAQYTGFHTRPLAAAGTFNVADAAHPSSGDCSQCHSGTNFFTGQDKPANHIPYAATAQCSACHTNGSDYAVMPTLAHIHANAPSASTNCAQCHGGAAASFAIPAAGFSIVGLPSNHIPTSAACEACHVGTGSSVAATPVVDGAKFSGSRMSHAGITNNCVQCHVPSGTSTSFAGIASIVGMPATSPMGANSHIPSNTTCESCHLGTLANVSGLVAANATQAAPGTAFATPAPTTAQIHAGVTSGCSSCHESNSVWMGVSAYPIAPTVLTANAQYTGFQTRPLVAAGTYNVADAAHPSAGDCSQCHSGTNFFTGQDKPANHIPYAATAQCSSCHTSGNDYAVMPTLTNIHAYAPSTSTNCAQCHGNAAASFAIPAANFSIVGLPSNHIPTSASCESCHVGTASSIAATPVVDGAKFTGSKMSHSGITNNCVACHVPSGTSTSFVGITNIVGMPATTPMGATSHIPSSTTCESCHLGTLANVSGLVAANATQTAPGTAFATPAPTTAQIHAGVTSGCASCHESSYVWMGVSAYPIAPAALTNVTNQEYTGFQTRPRTLAGTYNVADAAHPGTGDCSQCHSGTNYFTANDKPANHIPYAATAQCSACHTHGNDYAAMPTLTDIHANAPSTSSNCAQCHGNAAASFAIPAANFSVVGLPSNHIPTNVACETCHVGTGSSIAATPVVNGAKFSGSKMSHSGITNNCVACHVPAGPLPNFVGITSIVGMPATTPMGPTSHIPSSTTCESCHLGTLANVSGLVPANATKTAPGTAFETPTPTTAQIHSGVTSGCASCHESSYVWMGVSAYPIAPATLTNVASQQYTGFQTRPRNAAGTYNVADPAHPNTGDCSQCHSGTTFFTGQDKPANHIPYAATAQCSACHTHGNDYAAMPTLTDIHANAPSTNTNCAQCHGSAAASFAIPAANFTIVGLPSNHIPTNAACEACHVGTGSSMAATPVLNGAKFSGSKMSHAGISNNCEACHVPSGTSISFAGITTIVGMPPTSPMGSTSHIPYSSSSASCASCHLGTLANVSGLVPANATKTAPGSLFATPAPTTAQIHSGITSGCNACHESSYVWMAVNAYPIAPTTKITGAQYTGFHTRPRTAAGTYNVADASHPSTGDCSQCHSGTNYFSGQDKPANHIPYSATAECSACHTIPGDYATMPTLANIHANAQSTSTNCAQCHGAAAASFAIPAANFSIVGLPGNHIPTNAACELCHVGAGSSMAATPVGNGAKFSGSLMSHSGVTNNCVACHGPAIKSTTFAGITQIVVLPPTSPMGATSHIPSSTTCESCHLGTLANVSGLVPANTGKNAPGSLFATPAPTTAQIHSGITSGCSGCHESNYQWMAMSPYYAIAPTTKVTGAQYTGFHTRPLATAGTYRVADATHPSTGDCSQCHSGTNFFSGQDKPANHIPYAATASCNQCHTTPGDFTTMPTLTNIHAYAQSTSSNCAQCHGSSAASFAIPAINFSIVGLPSNHIPTSVACETCHVGTGSSMAATPVVNGAKFSGSKMSHSGATNNCVACHVPSGTPANFIGITSIVGLPPTTPMGPNSHIPSSTTCESCHLGTLANVSGLVPANATKTAPGTAFATPAPTTTQIHGGITSGCNACHESSYVWMGVSAYPIAPSTLINVANQQYTGFQTRPRTAAGTYNIANPAHPSTGDCSQCHSGTNFFVGQDKPANHIPYSATAQCNQCHTSTDYAVLPTLANIHLYAPSTSTNCAQCHGAAAASFAIPAANFTIVGLPGNHVPTTAACELCHVGAGSSITATPVPNGAKFSGSKMSHSGVTNNCVACHGPAIKSTTFAGITNIIVLPPTSPMGSTSHIPSSTTCESCHLGTLANVSGLVPGNATKPVPGSLFATPAPTTAQIHSGITSGCNACHESSYLWMTMTAYPIAPATKSATAGTQYTGFHTRPRAAAGTYNVLDAAHPTTGDCSQCHSGTNFFTGQDKPANHIPYAATANCNQCHTIPGDYSTMPTLANIHLYAQSTSTNCAQCHGATAASFAIPAANFSIVGLPSNHIPTSAACELCHVGTGSSIATTPVPNGAKFSASRMSHSGITNNCVACHGANILSTTFIGITKIVVLPPVSPMGATSHIPSSTTCESCHLGTLANVSGLAPANATKVTGPGTLFATPAPTTAQIHSGITSGCNACHESSYVWMTMTAYPIAPTTKSATAGTQYTGFQTRPRTAAGTYNVLDALHPTTGDCSQCHSGTNFFSGQDKPANHIPYLATATCNQCHTTPGDYATMPTLTNIHLYAQSTSTNCAQCHSAAAAASFAIPAANFTIVGLPSNHIPTVAACELCHVGAGSSIATTPVVNGAKFSGSLMNHTADHNNCVACHGPTILSTSFKGITKIVVMPPTSPMGATSHMPSSTTCETCHAGSEPAGMVAANATTTTVPGTKFATPVPTTAQIHTGITSGCSTCHESPYVWVGMANYPISPKVVTSGAQYIGFQTRPKATAGTYYVADAAHAVGALATGDCSQCHSGTTYFSAQAQPAGHIPTTMACATCHVVSGDFSIAGLTTNMTTMHTGITSNCIKCHSVGTGYGPFAGCTTQASCASPPPLTYQPKATPLAPGGSPTAPSTLTHVPVVSVACEKCHSATVFTSFAGMNMKSNTNAHVAALVVTPKCIGCHEGGPPTAYTWYGVTITTRAVGHEGRKAGQDCIACHSKTYGPKFAGAEARIRPIPLLRSALIASKPRLLPNIMPLPGAADGIEQQAFDHQGVLPGECKTCHNGKAARGLPTTQHLANKSSCDMCHRTTAWVPAQFDHKGTAMGQCSTCHNSALASGKPGSHFLTARSCDACHRTLSWVPASYSHLSPAYRPAPDKLTCVSCHITNGEIIPRQMRGNPRVRPVPVPPGP